MHELLDEPQGRGRAGPVDPLIECTQSTLNLTAYPGGKAFLAAYKAMYRGLTPERVRAARL